MLRVDLDEHSLLARDPGEGIDDLLRSVIFGSGQDLVVLQLTFVLESGLREEAYSQPSQLQDPGVKEQRISYRCLGRRQTEGTWHRC